MLSTKENLLDWVSQMLSKLFGLRHCIFCRREAEDLDCISWNYDLTYSIWSRFFEEFGLVLARHKGCREIIDKFILHPFLQEWSFFVACQAVLFYAISEPRETIEFSEGLSILRVIFDWMPLLQ